MRKNEGELSSLDVIKGTLQIIKEKDAERGVNCDLYIEKLGELSGYQ